MKLLRVGHPGQERPVVITTNGRCLDLRPFTPDVDASLLTQLDALLTAVDRDELPDTSIEGERIGSPLARPASLICVGMNYAEHAAESGATPPEHVIVFFKKPTCVVGPNDDVLLPSGSTHLDWEVELGVVIGRSSRGFTGAPVDLVAGYVLGNDVSERAWQLEVSGGQWSKGKCGDTFNPLGPWIATADEMADAQALRLRSWVNGEPRQDSTTADMIFSVTDILTDLCKYMTLEPGDVIMTGTPQGVALSGRFPYLISGDVMRLEIDGLGSMQQAVR